MDGVVFGFGQKLCFLLFTWAGTAGQCYYVSHARSMGYAALSGAVLITAAITFALTRRFRD